MVTSNRAEGDLSVSGADGEQENPVGKGGRFGVGDDDGFLMQIVPHFADCLLGGLVMEGIGNDEGSVLVGPGGAQTGGKEEGGDV